MTAVKSYHFDCAQTLVEAGATLDSYGNTALMRAVNGGHVNCMRALVRAGADVNFKFKNEEENDDEDDDCDGYDSDREMKEVTTRSYNIASRIILRVDT